MRKALRWAGIGLGGLIALLILAAIVVYAWSEIVLRREYRAVAETLPAPSAAERAAAPRLARVLGCLGCHGEGLRGRVMFDAPGVARVFAPNITEVASKASDQQLAAGIRQGIGHDGRGLFIMPSPMYSHLTDRETASLVAWIRTLPRAEGQTRGLSAGPLGRIGLVTGAFQAGPERVAEYRRQVPIALGPEHEAARHLAATACSECHGPALMGGSVGPDEKTPDLAIAAGYDAAQFRTLMRTGRPPTGRDLGLMTTVAKQDFSHLTDAEIDSLHAYLVARAKRLGS
ncbi:MAG TPA: c-type cytochrome [Allosphingosinicella sp.]|jgi:mono/diheme cytochrome c family protein|nr:c-type cytochrome [Allosphingosinicella sp.]